MNARPPQVPNQLADLVELPVALHRRAECETGPHSVAQPARAVQAVTAPAVASALHPIFWIVSALGAMGFVMPLRLEEIPLANRMVPRGE